MTKIREIREMSQTRLEMHNANKMGEAGLYFQLMEEAGELVQACAKKLRALGYGQPLAEGLTEDETEHNFYEEAADTMLVIDEILLIRAVHDREHDPIDTYDAQVKAITDIQMDKLKRTAARYEEAERESRKDLEKKIVGEMLNYNILKRNGAGNNIPGYYTHRAFRIDNMIDALQALGIPAEQIVDGGRFVALKTEDHTYSIDELERGLAEASRRQELLDEFLPVAQYLDPSLTDFAYQKDCNCVEVEKSGTAAYEVSAGNNMGEMLTFLLAAILRSQ